MTTSHIIDLLVAEKEKLDRAIAALQGDSNVPDWVTGKKAAAPAKTSPATGPKTRRPMSEEGKERIREALRRRHAAAKLAKEGAMEKTAAPRKTNSVKIAEAIAPKEDQEFKSKMSIAMAKSWASRRKAAKKKKAA